MANKKSSSLQVIGVNFEDEISNAAAFIKNKELPWINGIADDELIKQLRIYGAPRYILLSPENKIEIMDGNLLEIEKFLEKKLK